MRRALRGLVPIVTAGVLATAVVSCAGDPATTERDEPARAAVAERFATASPTPGPSPSATRGPSPTPRRTPTRRPTPSVKPKIPLPPPPNPPQVPPPSPGASGPTCPTYAGPKAPVGDVKSALTAAATRPWWTGASKPTGYTGDGSDITVPVNLIKAVAWQESGWQSTIVACDGGIGTMQVMPGTADWMNQRFGTSHNVNTLAGNTALGAEYLQWLIMYFGLYYFGSFDLSVTAPVGANGATMRLRDVVIAGYNVGPGAIEVIVPDPGADYLKIPNQSYVNNVVALTTNCVCLSY